jgi:hypothetical protein
LAIFVIFCRDPFSFKGRDLGGIISGDVGGTKAITM